MSVWKICQLLRFDVSEFSVQAGNFIYKFPTPLIALVESFPVGASQQWVLFHLADDLPIALCPDHCHRPIANVLTTETLLLALSALLQHPLVVLQVSDPFHFSEIRLLPHTVEYFKPRVFCHALKGLILVSRVVLPIVAVDA